MEHGESARKRGGESDHHDPQYDNQQGEGVNHPEDMPGPDLMGKSYCPYCGGTTSHGQWEGRDRRYCRNCRRPLYDNPIPAVCAVVFDTHDRILLVQRKVAPRRGEWCLPGGFMELEETPEAAVLRELREETGLDGQVTGLIGLKAAPNRIYHTVLVAGYRVAPLSTSIHAGDDAMTVRWFHCQEMPPIAFGSHRAFIRCVLESRSASRHRNHHN